MSSTKTPTDLILGKDGLLDRISSIQTSDTDAQEDQQALSRVLKHLHEEDTHILDRPDEVKLSKKERKRLVKLLKFIHKKLQAIRRIYNLVGFIEKFNNHLSLSELEKQLPPKKPKSRLVAHR